MHIPTFHAIVIPKQTLYLTSQSLWVLSEITTPFFNYLSLDLCRFWGWVCEWGWLWRSWNEWVGWYGYTKKDKCGRESMLHRERERERERRDMKKMVNLCCSLPKLYHVWVLDSLAGFLLCLWTIPYPRHTKTTPALPTAPTPCRLAPHSLSLFLSLSKLSSNPFF